MEEGAKEARLSRARTRMGISGLNGSVETKVKARKVCNSFIIFKKDWSAWSGCWCNFCQTRVPGVAVDLKGKDPHQRGTHQTPPPGNAPAENKEAEGPRSVTTKVGCAEGVEP